MIHGEFVQSRPHPIVRLLDLLLYLRPVSFEHSSCVERLPTVFGVHRHLQSQLSPKIIAKPILPVKQKSYGSVPPENCRTRDENKAKMLNCLVDEGRKRVILI